jgi:hypothetical protein
VWTYLSGERGFGIVFASAFLLIGLRYSLPPAFGVSALLLATAFLRPEFLRKPNRIWMSLAEFLARVTNPIMTAALFYLIITPIGLAARGMGQDSLRRRRDPGTASYWITRKPPGSMANQF